MTDYRLEYLRHEYEYIRSLDLALFAMLFGLMIFIFDRQDYYEAHQLFFDLLGYTMLVLTAIALYFTIKKKNKFTKYLKEKIDV